MDIPRHFYWLSVYGEYWTKIAGKSKTTTVENRDDVLQLITSCIESRSGHLLCKLKHHISFQR